MADTKKPQTSTLTSPPGGNRPPPKPTVAIEVKEPEYELYGGERDGEIATIEEAQKYLKQGFGYIELPSKKVFTATPQPGAAGQQPPHKPGEKWIQIPFGSERGKWVTEAEYTQKYGPTIETQRQPISPPITGKITRLAQPTGPLPTPEKPEIISPYSDADQKRIGEIKEFIKEQPPGPGRNYLEEKESEYIKQAQKNVEEKPGPVPIENLPIIKKMVGEFKDFYYQGYAKVVEQAKVSAGPQAWNAEYGQKQAVQYGMSSLTDLHRGLDLASWNFFFKILGPLGSVLEHYHQQKIGWDMSYYGRAWWSPYRIDYLIKTLPEEKAFDLAYEAFRNTIYYVNKIAGSPIFSKTAAFDRYGRKTNKDFVVFTPLLKMQKGLNVVGILADNLSQRNTYAISLAFQKYQEGKKKFRNNPIELKKAKDDWITFKNDNGDKIRNKLARFLGVGSIARNIRKTHRDPLSFLAILIGEWLFDITVGNLFRSTLGAIAERLAASKLGIAMQEFFSGKYMTAGQMLGSGLTEAGRAVFSVNTIGGGLIGYQLGGVPGALVGAGGGWFWQTVRNFGLDETRMVWTQRYLDFLKDEKYFGGKFTTNEFVLGPKLELQPTWVKFFDIKFNIAGRTFYPFRGMLTPGPISRFANWLNTGELRLGGFKIPVGQLVKPLPSVFINGTLMRFYVSPFLTQIGIQFGWDPNIINLINSPVFQYGLPALWEYRPLIGNLWGNILQRLFYTGESFGFMTGEYTFARMGGGPGVGYIFDKAGSINYVVYENESGTGFRAIKTTGFNKNILKVRSGIWETYQRNVGQPVYRVWQNILQEHQGFAKFLEQFKAFNKVGVTNFSGFFIGWEIASVIGVNPLIGGLVGFFGINTGLFITYRVADLIFSNFGYNLLPGFFSRFVGLFNTGFWLGTGVQTIFGLFGINIPLITPLVTSWWFPLATSGIFSLSPIFLQWTAFAISSFAPTAAAFLTSFAAGITAGAAGLAALTTVLAVGSVAALAVFSIIIIGSAFWVPIQENLKGLTATSPCFDISSPTFGQNNIPLFAKGETKKVCWTTTNKQNLYTGPITKTKTLDPPQAFNIVGYDVNVTTQTGTETWSSPGTSVGGYKLEVNDTHTIINPGTDNAQTVVDGREFKITPPIDAGNSVYKQQIRAQVVNMLTQSPNNSYSANELIALSSIPYSQNKIMSDYVLQKELNFLNSIQNTVDQDVVKSGSTNTLAQITSSLSSNPNLVSQYAANANSQASIFIRACKNNSGFSPACDQINQGSGGVVDAILSQAKNDFNTIQGASPATRLQMISSLNNQIQSINNGSLAPEIDLINYVKNSFPQPPANINDPAVQTKIDNIVNSNTPNQTQYYIPSGSTITVCLTVQYNGDSNSLAGLTEKDAANVPVIGPLTAPYCQAQLITPINAAGPGNLLWPTDKRSVSGYGYTADHKGVDIAGTPGTPARAASSGTIIKEGNDPASRDKNGVLLSLGNYIIIQGDDGNYCLYGHLGTNVGTSGAFIKNTGDRVNAGDGIGYIGNSGITAGANGGVHLHFGVSTTASGTGASDFYNNSTTTLNPCGFLQGGCP